MSSGGRSRTARDETNLVSQSVKRGPAGTFERYTLRTPLQTQYSVLPHSTSAQRPCWPSGAAAGKNHERFQISQGVG